MCRMSFFKCINYVTKTQDINYINFVWFPALIFAEKIGLKMPVKRNNRLEADDIENLLKISDFDVISYSREIFTLSISREFLF